MRRTIHSGLAIGAASLLLAVSSTAASAAAPDGRAYERVSPTDKNYADVTQAIASADGDHVQVNALSTAFGDAFGNPLTSYAIERQADGWQTRAVNFAARQPTAVSPVLADATDDLSRRVIFGSVVSTSPPPDSAESLWVGGASAQDRIREQAVTFSDSDLRYAGMSADAGHVFFHSGEKIGPAAQAQVAGRQLYDFSGGTTTIVGVQSDGVTLTSPCGAVLGNGSAAKDFDPVTFTPGAGGGTINAVSRNGDTAFFQSPDPRATGDPSCDEASRLYVRRGSSTVEASAPRPGAPNDAPADVTYQGAAADGSRVFFTTTQRLVPGLPDNASQLYAFDPRSGDLRVISAGDDETASADVRGTVAFSRDGRVAYFVAGGALAPGATAGENNLYRWQAGTTAFVATLGVGDTDSFTATGQPGELQARTSAEGRRLVFRSQRNLDAGGYDAGGTAQLYLYDGEASDIRCVSCRPDGASPTESATIAGNTAQSQVLTAIMHTAAGMSDDGSKVFFQSADAVVPGAENGKANVYEWDAGTVSLISSGTGEDDSLYIGNSASGRDVFFATADRLVSSDTDGNFDIYDARVGGGIPESPTPTPCDGDACQGAPSGIPGVTAPGSTVTSGRGNVTPSVDDRTIRPKLLLSKVTKGALKAAGRTGVLRLRVRVAGSGTVSARSTARVDGKAKRVAVGTAKARGKSSTLFIRLRLSGAARAALRSRGSLRVRTVVRMPKATTRTITVTLKNRGSK